MDKVEGELPLFTIQIRFSAVRKIRVNRNIKIPTVPLHLLLPNGTDPLSPPAGGGKPAEPASAPGALVTFNKKEGSSHPSLS